MKLEVLKKLKGLVDGNYQITLTAVMVLMFIFAFVSLTGSSHSLYSSDGFYNNTDSESYSDYDGCNVAGVMLRGDLYTYYDNDSQSVDDVSTSENIVYALENAEVDPNIQAIFFEINSYGGSPVAALEIVDTLNNFVEKPVIAQIREAGLSAAYWVGSASDIIFATTLSDVGSIGITQSYVDEGVVNQREGYTYNSLSTGKFKDMLDPQKSLTWEERQILERDLKIMHDVFVRSVAENRGMEVADIEKLADGSSMLGEMALKKGLIDRIGGYYEIEDYLIYELGIGDPRICW